MSHGVCAVAPSHEYASGQHIECRMSYHLAALAPDHRAVDVVDDDLDPRESSSTVASSNQHAVAIATEAEHRARCVRGGMVPQNADKW